MLPITWQECSGLHARTDYLKQKTCWLDRQMHQAHQDGKSEAQADALPLSIGKEQSSHSGTLAEACIRKNVFCSASSITCSHMLDGAACYLTQDPVTGWLLLKPLLQQGEGILYSSVPCCLGGPHAWRRVLQQQQCHLHLPAAGHMPAGMLTVNCHQALPAAAAPPDSRTSSSLALATRCGASIKWKSAWLFSALRSEPILALKVCRQTNASAQGVPQPTTA